jgi:hypothetical protein
MTDVLTIEPPTSEPAACLNCGAALHGPFCARCGQEAKPLDPPVRYFARELAEDLFDADSRVLRSLRRLLFSPGFLTREYVEGRRASWISPTKLYLLASVAAFGVLAFTGTDGGLRIDVWATAGDSPGTQVLGYENPAALASAIDAAREVWVPRVMFLLVPIFGWLVSGARRRAGRRYPAHLVFALHVHAAWFAGRAAATTLGAILPAGRPWFELGLFAYIVASLFLAFRGAYGGTRMRALRDTLVVGIVYWVLLLVGTGIAVVTVVVGREMLRVVGG